MITIIIKETGESRAFFGTVESHSPSIAVTDHPIEDGSLVSDHAQREPTPVVVDVVETRTPFGQLGDPSADDADVEALQFLERCVGQELDLVTLRLGTITGLMLVAWPHEFTRRKSLPMTLTFKPVTFAQAISVELPARRLKVKKLQGETDRGNQPAKKITDLSEQRKDMSFLRAKLGDPNARAAQLSNVLGL